MRKLLFIIFQLLFVSAFGQGVKISDLQSAGALTGAELVPVVQNGQNRKTTASAVAGLTSGTVTSVATGFGLSGGAITTSGTLRADTSRKSGLPTYYYADSIASATIDTSRTNAVSNVAGVSPVSVATSGKTKFVSCPTCLTTSQRSSSQLLGSLVGANMNTTADQAISLAGGSSFVITDIIITNSSADLSGGTISDGQLWDGTLRSGDQFATTTIGSGTSLDLLPTVLTSSDAFISNNQSMQLFTSVTNFNPFILALFAADNTVYWSLSAGHGSAATADIYVFGFIIN